MSIFDKTEWNKSGDDSSPSFDFLDAVQSFGMGFAASARAQGGQLSYMAAKSQESAARFQGAMAAMAMQEKAWMFLQEGMRTNSRQVVQGAAAGIDLSSQSFQMIQAETLQNFHNDARKMFNQAEVSRLVGEANAAGYAAQASAIKSANNMGFLSEIIKGSTSLLKMWDQSGNVQI